MAMDVGEWNGNRGWAPSAEDRGRCLGLGRSSLIPCPKKQRTTPQQEEEEEEDEDEEEEGEGGGEEDEEEEGEEGEDEDEEGEGGGEEDEEEEGEEGEEEEENAGGGGGGADEEEEGGGGGGGGGGDEDEDEDEEEEEAEAEEEEASESNGIGCSNSGDCGDRSISVTLTDPDILDCPICCENLSVPVFQCQNGHLACSSCYSKLGGKCPSCSSLAGYYRCRGVENILESVKIPCRNMKYGCKEMVLCCKRPDHEDECPCAPCSCPLLDCNFVGSSENLYIHFSMKHSNSAKSFCYDNRIPISLDKQQKYLILQEEEEGTLFIINNGVEPNGNVINVSCIGQSSTSIGYSYYLLVKNGGSSLMLKSYTGFVPAWVEHTPPSRFLVVPSDFVGSCGKLKLELNISGKPF